MADVRKTVEIALKVVGVDLKKIDSLAESFKKVQTSVDGAVKSVERLQTTLSALKTPDSLTRIVSNLQKLENLKIPSLNSLAIGFEKIAKIETPPDLAPFVKELQKFAKIRLPGLTNMVNGFKKLTELNVNNVINRIRSLNTALRELDKRGGMSVFKQLSKDVAYLRSVFGSASQASQKLIHALGQTGNAAETAGFKIRTFGDKVRTVFEFRLISMALQNLQQVMRDGITAIVEYDQALKDLQAITGATSLEVAQMGIKILEVASTTKFSASEVAEGMRTIGQAGFSATEAVETMQAVSDLATGTLSDMKTTVDLVTTAMRVFQIDATESAMVADVFANAVNRSKLTIDKLRTAMNYIGPIARDSGVSFKELSASMMTLANSGLRASTIGTGLRRVFAELIDPSKRLKAAAEQAGVALNELDPRSTSLSEVMQNLGLVVNDAQEAFDLFGKRGAAAVLALSNTESRFNEMLATVSRTGTAAQQAAIQMEGLGVSFKNLQDKLGLLFIALGEAGIAAAMKLLIDVARDLVDALTFLAGTTIGKVIVQFGLLVTAALAVKVAMIGLSKVLALNIFASLISGAGAAIKSLGLLTTSVNLFKASLGPLALAITAVTSALIWMNANSENVSDELRKNADNFQNLTKKYGDYLIKVASLKDETTELKDANLALRQDLFKVATTFTGVSEEARNAANSINPLTGEIMDSSEALNTYKSRLDALTFDSLVRSANEADRSIRESGNVFNRTINRMWSDVKNLGNILIGNTEELSNSTIEASFFAKEISKGNVSIKEMGDYIDGIDMSRLNDQQKIIIKNYDWINDQGAQFLKFLNDSGRIGLGTTVEEFKRLADEAEVTGIVLESALEQFKAIQEANTGSFSNIIEKWALDGTDSVAEFIEEYKRLGGVFKEGEERQIRESEIHKKNLVNRLNYYKQEVQGAIAAGQDTEEAWKDYYIKERKLLQEAALVREQISKNSSGQNIKLIIQERKGLQSELDKIAIQYKNNAQLRVKYQEDATREYLEKQKKLVQGYAIDPEKEKQAYEENLANRSIAYQKHLEDIALLESKGVIDTERANLLKKQSTIRFYEESVKEAEKYRDAVNRIDSPEEFDKRQKLVLKAEEKYYQERHKFLVEFNKDAKQANDKIVDLEEKLTDEKEKHLTKREEAQRKSARKREEIEQDYADKVEDINKALESKLSDIDSKISNNRKKAANDVLSLESDTEEKIRQIRREGLSDVGKEASDRRAASKYIREGRELLAQAERERDEEALDRGRDLIKQGESIAQGLESQKEAVRFLKDALEGLKDARNIEAELAELELLKQKEEEVAEAAAKKAEAKEAYERKVQNAETAITEIMEKEDARHNKEMQNLEAEISKVREKLELVKTALAVAEQGVEEVDTSASIAQERDRHDSEMQNIKDEKSAIVDKYTTARQEVDEYGNAISDIELGFDDSFDSLTDAARTAKTDVNDIMSEPVPVRIDTSEIEETQSMLDSVDGRVINILARVIGQENVDRLQRSIDRLRDKTITITTRYVTQGRAPERKSTGGRLPGFGGGDKVPVLGEAGEWWINKFAVRKYGDAFLSSINNMTLPKFQNGGKVAMPIDRGTPEGPSETLIVRFQAGGLESPVKVTDPDSRSAVKKMASELAKMRLVYAR